MWYFPLRSTFENQISAFTRHPVEKHFLLAAGGKFLFLFPPSEGVFMAVSFPFIPPFGEGGWAALHIAGQLDGFDTEDDMSTSTTNTTTTERTETTTTDTPPTDDEEILAKGDKGVFKFFLFLLLLLLGIVLPHWVLN